MDQWIYARNQGAPNERMKAMRVSFCPLCGGTEPLSVLCYPYPLPRHGRNMTLKLHPATELFAPRDIKVRVRGENNVVVDEYSLTALGYFRGHVGEYAVVPLGWVGMELDAVKGWCDDAIVVRTQCVRHPCLILDATVPRECC